MKYLNIIGKSRKLENRFKTIENHWDFPGGPVVKDMPGNSGGTGSVPGWGSKIPPAAEQLSPSTTGGLHRSLCSETREPSTVRGSPPATRKSPRTATRASAATPRQKVKCQEMEVNLPKTSMGKSSIEKITKVKARGEKCD